MTDNQYKVSLGVKLDTSDIQTQINAAGEKIKPIELKIDAETKELTNTIKDALNTLSKGTKNALTLDTSKIEASLKDVADEIRIIKSSIGTLDGGDMRSLLITINQINTALDKASNQFVELNRNLDALSRKDFSLDIGIKLGGSNSVVNNSLYGDFVKDDVLPTLKKQEQALTKYLAQYFNTNEFSAVDKLLSKSGNGLGGVGGVIEIMDRLESPLKKGESLKDRMREYKNFINSIISSANMQGVDLSPVLSQFEKLPNELIETADNIRNGTKQVDDSIDKLKQVFGGGGIDAEGLSVSLEPITKDLNEIREAVVNLSKGVSIEGLTQSFDRLSETLEQLMINANLVQDVLSNGFSGATQKVNQAAQKSLNIDDVIDKQVSRLMNEYAIAGEKGSKAFDEIRQSLVDFRNGSGDINKVTSAISNNMKVVNEAKNDYKDLAEYIKMFNASGAKVHIPDSIRQEYGDDYKSMRSQLGKGFTSGQGMDFETFVVETNEILGQTIDLSHGAEAAFGDLVDKVNSTKGGKFLTGDDLFKNGVLDMGDVVADISTSLEKIENAEGEIARTSTSAANVVVQSEEKKQKAYRETANEAQKTSDNVEALKQDLNFNDASIDSMKQSFQELGIAIDSVTVNLKNGSLDSFTIKGTDGIERTVSATKKLDENITKITQSFTKAKNQADKIEFKIDTGKFNAEITKVTADFNKLSLKSDDIETDIKQLNAEFANMKMAAAAGDIDALINAYKEYDKILESVNNKLNINKTKQQEANRQQRQDYDIAKLEQDKKNFALEIDNYLKNNTAAAKEFGDQIRAIRMAIDSCDDSNALNELKAQLIGVKSEAKLALDDTQSFGDKIKKQWQQYSAYFGVAEVFMYAEQGLRSMFEQVKLIDSAMTELKKVTNETDAAYNKFLTNAADRSREIGTTIDGLVSSTADFARLGYGFEDAQGLAEVANIYAVVGDEINGVEGATESLISTMAAFKDEMNGMSNTDFAMSIIDKFNEIGNNFAISSGGIGEALERSVSSLMAANNTIDESIALITAANTVVQDPEQVGTAFKTISMRIRGAKTELEEAGLETDGMVESTAKLRSEILALTGVDIMDGANQFKSTYAIMDELAVKWKDLSDIQQATVTELIAGKRQGNIVSSLMTNFDTARDALETSLNSAGSAMQEHEKWQQSLEAQINKLKASWQSLSQTFLSSDFLKVAFDFVIKLVDGITLLIDKVGVLPTLLTGFSIFKSFGNKGLFKTLNNDLDGFINKIGIANKSFADLANAFNSGRNGKGLRGFVGGLSAMKNSLSNTLTKADLSNIRAYNDLLDQGVTSQTAWYRTMQSSSDSAKELVSAANGGKVALNGMKTASIGVKAGLIGAKVAAVAFNAALTIGISLLVDWAISGIMKLVNAKKELAEQVDELTSKFKEQSNELKKLKGDYDNSNESSMISKYEKLSKGVDGLGRNVSLTADEYSEYQSIVNTIADQIPSLISGYDEQGNALLSCKGNVEELTAAYEKLIHAQNNEVLTKSGDIEKDFKNAVKDVDGYWSNGFWETKLDYDNVRLLEKVLNGGLSEKEIVDLFESNKENSLGIAKALDEAGVDNVSIWSSDKKIAKAIAKTAKSDPQKLRSIIEDFSAELETQTEGMKTIIQAKLSEAFDVSNAISGLNYGSIGEELQTIAYQVANNLDFDFFAKLQEQGKTVEQWTDELLKQLNSVGKAYGDEIGNVFELQGKFNSGEVSYGEYVKELKEFDALLDTLNLKSEAKEQLKISVGLDENGVVDQYDALINRLTSQEIGLNDKAARNFVDSLSAEELAVLVDIVPSLDAGTTINEIQALIDEQLATEFKFDIKVQTEGIEAFNTALTESRSAAGLTSESITALKARYEDLDGFNAAALFEKTANGIHLNSEELSRLEEQYINTNKLDIENNLNKLVTKYNDLTEEIKGCTDAQEKENLQLQADTYKNKIDELSTLASQYDGLTSAFAKWQTALEGAEEGDNYDSLYENLEGIKELYDKGLVGTDKFKTAAQLMTNKDLANADIDEIVSAYKKGYPKMQRYFTEGQKGCKNFLNDVRNLNSEWAHMNKDGSWEINFNAEEVAKKLGVSVDFVLQIAKKLKDYGFEVNLEDSSVDNLKTKIEQTEAKLKELGQSPVDINVDIEANSANLGKIESEIEKAKNKIKEINSSSVDPKVKTAQLEDARAKLEALIDKKIEASQPAFMNLNTSQVNASLVDALEKIQDYQNAINEVNKLTELKEAGISIDDSQLKTAKEKVDECAKAIQGLDGDVKVAIGLEEDGSIDFIKKSFEEGKVKIDANTDPALTKIEQLAENVERIEDKDVTINVTVNGLDKVKELNKQIDLATDIDGDIDKLSEYVENAKELSKLGNNITSYVTAEVKGNVINTKEYKLDNLKVFGESAKEVKGLGTFTSKVTANVEGNVIETKESKLDNLKVFTNSAKDISKIGVVKSTVTADIKGNVADTKEYKIDNLKVFTDNAKDVSKIGVVTSKVTANIDGNVINTKESKIDNLKIFTDSAKDVRNISNVESKVSANIEGNVINTREGKLDNLKVFTDNAKDIKKIGNVESTVKANINGNVKDTKEGKLDNLKVFTDSAKDIAKIGDAKSTVTAEIKGNVIDTSEGKLDNIKVFTDNAKDIKNIGSVSSKVNAEVDGNVIETREGKLDNLKVFTDSAKDLKKIGTINSSVNANIGGNVIETKERKIDNLKIFADGANELKNTGSFESKVTANISGNVINTKEREIDNLGVFADNAKNLKGVGSFKSEVTANVRGNIIDTKERKIDNLKEFYDSAKDLKDVGSFESNVSANVDGNVINTKEYKIDNLRVFTNSAKNLKDIGTVSSKVTADVDGNVIDTREDKLDNLKVFFNSAKDISKIGVVKSSVNASINGNVIDTSEGKINNLKVFSDSAKDVKNVGSPTSNVTANVNGNVINTLEEKIDNLGVFATNANKLKGTGNFTSSVSANVSGNVITDDSVNSDLEHFASIVSGMSNKTVAVSVTANVDSANINNAIDLLTKVANSGVFKDYKATVQVGAKIATIDDTTVQNYKAPPKEGKVKYSVDPESSVYTWTAPSKDGVVNYSASVEALTDSQKHKTGTITYKAKISGFPVVNGTANANGSAFANGVSGKAFKQGDWGVKKTTTALTGELGQELVVYGNRFWTVGDHGAEFTTIPKGAIVFNHKQTEELFKNGKVTSDGGRGRMFANGTAFAEGTAFPTGSGTFKDEENEDEDVNDKFEEKFDWIEILLSRLERTIDNLDKTVNNVYKSWSDRNNALTDEISRVGQEIRVQQSAYNTYMAEANKVGLDGYLAAKVRDGTLDGTLDIQLITDESTAKKIKEYQKWYEKALDCKDAIEDLKQTESELYAQRFELIQSQYDGILQGYEHTESMLDEYISQAEAKGHIVSKKYYQALIGNEKNNIAELKKEQAALIDARDEAVASGAIVKGSEAWYDMCAEIDSVTQAIEEGTTALIEYDNAMRDIDWQIFDLIQERISDVTAEADFLIDLMSNDKLFDDNGKLTDKGMATMGLHGQNYNTYMYAADEYANEIAKLDKQIQSDPYDQELINRRRELVELQRESILAAEDEKNAIKDLVEEGIELELDALQERIDLHNEELDSIKDLYDYQKNVQKQSEEIASLEKQRAAYLNDDSEENKARLQEITVSLKEAKENLEETEYERYISDQRQLLDSLYEEYELILNERLDNVDALLSDMITEINANATTISTTLSTEAANVGITLSDAMKGIWSDDEGNAKSVITLYGEDFKTKLTTVNTTLNSIKSSINSMISHLDAEANNKVKSNKTSSSSVKNPTGTGSSSTTSSSSSSSSSGNKSTGDGKPKIGDKVKFLSGKYYYDSQGVNPAGSNYQGKEVYITNVNTKSWATHPYHISTGKKLGSGDLGWLKLNQISGYATGKKNFLNNEVAWTQENGQELIVRPSDGAILTPIAKRDSVLTSTASNNIWDMANSPAEFIKDNLNLGATNVPNNSTVQNVYSQHLDKVVFNLPNVKNYEQLLSEMQKDKNFERLILSMSIDRLAGRSSLAKGKSIR